MAYEMTYGEIPKGLIVGHKCDNPPCCNPAHLEAITHGKNSRDLYRRGRRPSLSAEQVQDILENPEGLTYRQLAAKHGVGYGAINSVRCKLSLARFTVDPSDPNNP